MYSALAMSIKYSKELIFLQNLHPKYFVLFTLELNINIPYTTTTYHKTNIIKLNKNNCITGKVVESIKTTNHSITVQHYCISSPLSRWRYLLKVFNVWIVLREKKLGKKKIYSPSNTTLFYRANSLYIQLKYLTF